MNLPRPGAGGIDGIDVRSTLADLSDLDGRVTLLVVLSPCALVLSVPSAVLAAIAAGADVKMVQTMLGHASAVMTLDRYGHLFPELDEAIDIRRRAQQPLAFPAGAAPPIARGGCRSGAPRA